MDAFISHDLTELPFGLPGRIYRSPMPFGAFDPQQWVLEHARQAGVSVVVDLVPDEEALQKTGIHLRSLYAQYGLQVIYMPIADFETPDPELLALALQAALEQARQGRHVMVHCNAGYGRTGTFVACLARLVFDLDGTQAVQWVRQYVPPALENEQQVNFVSRYNKISGNAAD